MKYPQGIMYVTKKAESVTKDVLAGKAPKKTKGGSTMEMDAGIAHFIVSNCLPFQQDCKYSNPSVEPGCHWQKSLQNLPSLNANFVTAASKCPKHFPLFSSTNDNHLQYQWLNS
jgi:hypothetical protein